MGRNGIICLQMGNDSKLVPGRQRTAIAWSHFVLRHLPSGKRPLCVLFMPVAFGADRFPGGNAQQLWQSIQRILQLPDDTHLFTGHDYRPNFREARWESTIATQKAHNQHLEGWDETKFIKFRTERDRSLPLPNLMLPALQVNIAAGHLPPPEADGRRYLKIPLNAVPDIR